MIRPMLLVMYLEWDIEWENSMAVVIFTVLLVGIILGGSVVYLFENHFRTNEMKKIYKLAESLINGNELDDFDIGKETLYSKTANQLIRLQEMLDGRRKEAEKSQYEIQKLISEIAHQLRTPLSNIKNYTELLQESLNETQEILNIEYMKDLRTSEEQLCFLVESFIKTARLEQGIMQVHMQKGNLVEAILNALGQIQKKAEDKDIFFQVKLPEKIICEHDKNWMCEAFYNVFDNAVKYSKSNSVIDISMKQTEMFYKIQIRDYGIGIKDGEENKIFQRFYRGEQARGHEGCGIGLYLSREIVLLQKGIMKAKQMKPGLLIEVNLPVSRTAPHNRSHRKTDYKNIPETNEVTHVKRFCLGKFDLCTDFSLINTGTIRFPFLSGNGREYNTFLFQTVDSFAFCCICKWNFVDSIGRRY